MIIFNYNNKFIVFKNIFITPCIAAEPDFTLKFLFQIPQEGDFRSIENPRAIFVDNPDEIFIMETMKDGVGIKVFDSDGILIQSIRGMKRFKGAQDIVVSDDGRIFLSHPYKHNIAVLDIGGRLLYYMDLEGVENAGTLYPTRLNIDHRDNLYVVDSKQNRVLIFDSDGIFKREIKGDENGKIRFQGISDLCVDKKGRVYILDKILGKVLVFEGNGGFINKFGRRGGKEGTLSQPFGVDVDSKGFAYVVDSMKHSILIYDRKGRYLFTFGGLGRGEGWFYFPSTIQIDKKDRIYVLDKENGRIQVLERELIVNGK